MDGNLEKPIKKMLDITPGKGAKAKALSKKMGKKEIVGYGKSFSSEKDHDAYKKYMSEKRARAKARKTPDDAERASIRKHFASEAKHFGM